MPASIRWTAAMALAGLLCASTHAAPQPAAAEKQAVVASFQAFLDGLGKRDKTIMSKQILPEGGVTLMRDGKPMQMSLDKLADRLSQPGTEPREERIHDPLVLIDGDVAILWAKFDFLANGKIDHCGRDIATLVKVDGQWLISSIEDNGRKSCGGH